MSTVYSAKGLLKLLQSGQDGTLKHNENMEVVDTLLNRLVLDRDLLTPPGSPAEGDTYIVADTGAATGDWTGLETYIVVYVGSAWLGIAPYEGMRVYIQDETLEVRFNGTSWVRVETDSAKMYDYFRNVGTSPLEEWYVAGSDRGNLGTATPAANQLYAIPLVIPTKRTLDRIGVNFTVAGGGNWRVGIYRATSETNLYPAAMVLDTGGAAVGAGAQTWSGTQVLEAGPYWAVYNSDNATNTLRAITVNTAMKSFLGFDNTLPNTPNEGLIVAHTYGALPNPFTGGATKLTTAGILPAMFVRFSA